MTNKETKITIQNLCFHIRRHYSIYSPYTDCDYVIWYNSININLLARVFISFFKIEYPLVIEQLLKICNNSGFTVTPLSNDHKPRGYHFSYGKDVRIFIKENDPPNAQIHTLLHELYEIIADNLIEYSNNSLELERQVIEAKADEFAARVHVPDWTVFDWIENNGIDVFGLKDKLACSYETALIRMHRMMCIFTKTNSGEYLTVISLLYERPYWESLPMTELTEFKLKSYKKSTGFPFSLKSNELKDLRFHFKTKRNITILDFVNFSARKLRNTFFRNIEMEFGTTSLAVDILIRNVMWTTYFYPVKILIQIVPSDRKLLRELAERINVIFMN